MKKFSQSARYRKSHAEYIEALLHSGHVISVPLSIPYFYWSQTNDLLRAFRPMSSSAIPHHCRIRDSSVERCPERDSF